MAARLLFLLIAVTSSTQTQGYEQIVVLERGTTTDCYNVPQLLTLSNGAPVDDKTNTMTAGPCGPTLLQDTLHIEEQAFFNREKIPERFAHAKGGGAFGYLEITDDSVTQYCKASLFERVGKRTNLVIRFSTAVLEQGSCDSVRGLRGVAVKFYTDDGNWDLVCNNTPVFHLRDPLAIVSAFHASRRSPDSNLGNLTMFWDFFSQRPEATHQLLIASSDRVIPADYRHMPFWGGHTFKFVNRAGEPFYCKFHFKTDQGIQSLTLAEGAALCAKDYDSANRDLYNNIAEGNYPSWTMYYQVMTFKEAEEFRWDPFDLTKIWPKGEFPLHEIGRLVLDKNPTNYFVDVEQTAFSPANLVPGIEPSPDRVLVARMFAYSDAQRYRLGINHQRLPVNAPRVAVLTNTRDGAMAWGDNQGGKPNYFPNSYGQNVCPGAAESRWSVTGDVKRDDTTDLDNFSQPQVLWNKVFNATQKTTVVFNLAAAMVGVPDFILARVVDMFSNVSEDLGVLLAEAVGLKKA